MSLHKYEFFLVLSAGNSSRASESVKIRIRVTKSPRATCSNNFVPVENYARYNTIGIYAKSAMFFAAFAVPARKTKQGPYKNGDFMRARVSQGHFSRRDGRRLAFFV